MATIADDAPGTSTAPVFTVHGAGYGFEAAVQTSGALLPHLPWPLIPPSSVAMAGAAQRIGFSFRQTQSADGQPLFTVGEEGVQIFCSPDVELAARVLESQIHLEIAARTEQAIFVHAGVVRWGGRALVIPGPSHSGKSTLVDALVAAGATYYSDEYAVLDLEGRIHAFPRELRLRGGRVQERRAGLSREAAEPLQAGWVFNLRYRAGAVLEPKELTPGQTLLTLLANTVAVRRQSELTVRTLRLATAPAQGWYSLRGDAAEAAEQILQMIEQTPGGEAISQPGTHRENRP